MRTIHFHKSKCGVDLLMNIGSFCDFQGYFFSDEVHNTDFFEIIFFHKAKGELILGTRSINLHDNLMVFISPFEKRQWKVNKEDIDAGYLIFQEDFLNDFFADKFFSYRLQYFHQQQFPVHMEAAPELMQRLQELSSEMKNELTNSQFDSAHIIRSLLYYMLMRINRCYCEKYQLTTRTPLNNYAYQFKMLLEEHIYEKQRIEDYSELMGVSRITLNKAVKTQFNLSASQLLKQRLLQEIKNELLYTNQSIRELSERLNFSEPQHFIRFFKQHTQVTPAQYRQAEGKLY